MRCEQESLWVGIAFAIANQKRARNAKKTIRTSDTTMLIFTSFPGPPPFLSHSCYLICWLSTYKKVCMCDQAPFQSFWVGPGDEAIVSQAWSLGLQEILKLCSYVIVSLGLQISQLLNNESHIVTLSWPILHYSNECHSAIWLVTPSPPSLPLTLTGSYHSRRETFLIWHTQWMTTGWREH